MNEKVKTILILALIAGVVTLVFFWAGDRSRYEQQLSDVRADAARGVELSTRLGDKIRSIAEDNRQLVENNRRAGQLAVEAGNGLERIQLNSRRLTELLGQAIDLVRNQRENYQGIRNALAGAGN